MNRLRKIIALLCCLTVLQFPCRADAPLPAFETSATSDTVIINDTTYLLVDLKNNAGFGAAQFCILYDADKLLLEDVTLGEILPGTAITHVNTDVLGEINFSVISLENIMESGTVLIAKFKAVSDGTAKFDFKLLAYADSDTTSLDATGSDTEITVKSEEGENPPPPVTTEPPQTDTPPAGWIPPVIVIPPVTESPPVTDAPPVTEIPPEVITPPEITFADVSRSHWAHDYIRDAVGAGLFNGTGENTFSPEMPMTRAMFVTVLHRYANKPPAVSAPFTDIEPSWYAAAVYWASENRIVNGTGDNKFSPHQYITRGEMAVILCRYMSGKSADPNILHTFADSGAIPDWGRDAMAWAVEKGLIRGRTGDSIAFSDTATRAEAAAIFMRFLNMQ